MHLKDRRKLFTWYTFTQRHQRSLSVPIEAVKKAMDPLLGYLSSTREKLVCDSGPVDGWYKCQSKLLLKRAYGAIVCHPIFERIYYVHEYSVQCNFRRHYRGHQFDWTHPQADTNPTLLPSWCGIENIRCDPNYFTFGRSTRRKSSRWEKRLFGSPILASNIECLNLANKWWINMD